MDFLKEYADNMITMLDSECKRLEKKINLFGGIFASNKDKKRLEYYNKLYNDKLEWYERQLEIEIEE